MAEQSETLIEHSLDTASVAVAQSSGVTTHRGGIMKDLKQLFKENVKHDESPADDSVDLPAWREFPRITIEEAARRLNQTADRMLKRGR
jgi:hypothetical protein